jgi:DNA-binding NtrC family response regulator
VLRPVLPLPQVDPEWGRVEVKEMAEKIRAALLQNSQATYAPALQQELRAQAVEFQSAESCRDIHALLASPNPPEVVLTDLRLADGTWEDVVRISQSASLPVNVIVVSRLADIRLYTEVIQRGAFDFIAPPFLTAELSHVLRTAYGNALKKREALSRRSTHSGTMEILPLLALAG